MSLRRHSLLLTVVHVRENHLFIALRQFLQIPMNRLYTNFVIVAGAAPYGVFPNQPQLYAAQGPPPPTYDQTLTHPMVDILFVIIVCYNL